MLIRTLSSLSISMALLLVPLSIFFIFLAYKLFQQPKFKLPPGPHPWPIIGNIPSIKPPRFRSLADLSHTYGPITSVWLGSSLNINVSSSYLARKVLKEYDHQLANRYRNKSVTIFTKDGNDLTWADYGPHYVKLRKVCTLELFSIKSIKALRPIREEEINAMVGSIFKDCTNPNNYGKSLVLRNYLKEVSFNVITRMVLGKRFGVLEGEVDKQLLEFKDIMTNELKLSAALGVVEHIPLLRWMFWLKKKDLDKHGEQKSRLMRAIMEEHTQARKKSGVTKHHFVDVLLGLQKEYDLSEDTIIGVLWDMISAGTDTSAIVVEWAMTELVKNPNVLNKALEEIDSVVGLGHTATERDLMNLPYLERIVKEALRLHPPTPLMLPHRANSDLKIGRYDIPKGSSVHVNAWAIGRDQNVWQDPLGFQPDRFVEEDVDMKGHDFRLLPFGAGRRVCPGAQLGVNLVTSMLGHLLHHFHWTLPQGVKPEDIDMLENPGLVAYMRTPLEVVPTLRLAKHLYQHESMDEM